MGVGGGSGRLALQRSWSGSLGFGSEQSSSLYGAGHWQDKQVSGGPGTGGGKQGSVMQLLWPMRGGVSAILGVAEYCLPAGEAFLVVQRAEECLPRAAWGRPGGGCHRRRGLKQLQ
jgi:hypothetical protein